MAINFTYYPVSNRVPGVFVEMDPSQANTSQTFQRTLIIGQMLSSGDGAGTATPEHPIEVESMVQVMLAVGRGSLLAQMAQTYLTADTFGDLWLLPLEDNPAAQPAVGSVQIVGRCTSPGTLNLYIGGTRVQAAVNLGDGPEEIVASLLAVMSVMPDLAVSGETGTTDPLPGTLKLTAKNKGEAGNDIDLRVNYLGQLGGEFLPIGITANVTPMAGGSANPNIGDALANLSDHTYDFIIQPYTDTANLNEIQAFLNDQTGRWSWEQMLYGGAFSAHKGTLGEQTFFGESRNDQHMSIIAYNDSPDPPWIWAAQVGGYCAASLRVDPGLPLQYIGTTLKAPPIPSRWSIGERNTLLYGGMSTFRVNDAGQVIIERMATTYQRNMAGADDNSYLDVETIYGLMFVARNLTNYLLTRYARKKLVSDQTPILPGSNCVSAAMIRASVIAAYVDLETAGYVQNSVIFRKTVVAENAGNGLVKLLAPVDLVDQLRQIAILLQFRKS